MSSLSSKRPYGHSAKLYRAAGFLGTLPLPPKLKYHPPKGFTGGGREHPSDKQVDNWINSRADGNIALRLAEVPNEFLSGRKLPAVYANNAVDGWELLGVDVDDYKDKHGHAEYLELAKKLGPLPATAMSSARFSTWAEHKSSIRVFLVPKGYRYMGKAADSIEVVQKRHRYMGAWPSTNPDAGNALYEWRYGSAEDDTLYFFDDEIPQLGDADDVAVLPESWFNYLSRQGQVETDDPISSMTDDELFQWCTTHLRFGEADAEDNFSDEGVCKWMREAVEKYVGELDSSSDSHTKLTPAHWRLLNLAAEGHSGLGWALAEFHTAWYEHVGAHRGGDPEDVSDEITRSVLGALSKIHPVWIDAEGNPRALPDDTCAVMEEVADGKWTERVDNWSLGDERVSERDYGGLGPIVGKLLDTSRAEHMAKPAGDYGRHDFGNGQHFVDLYGANVKYVGARSSWVLWDGFRWHRDENDRLIRRAFQAVRQRQERYAGEAAKNAAGDPTDKAAGAVAKAWTAWAKRSGDVGPVKNALEASQTAYVNDNDPVVLNASKLDGAPTLLGCANGVIDLMDDEPDTRPPRKEDYVTYNTNVDYVPWRLLAMGDTTTEAGLKGFEGFVLWQDYLDHFMPDPELQKFIRKVMGHMLIGENPEKKIVFLYGKKDTGKSTLLGAISGALGDYYGTIDMSLFKQKDLNPGLVRAVPLRITGMSEADDSTKTGVIDASVVKRLTGNDKIMAELKYSNEIFEGRPQFTTVIACNNAPKITNADDALYERILVLPLDTQVEKAVRRYDLQKRIETESGTAVLAWLIEGWKDYRAEGLDPDAWPDKVKAANKAFTAQLNTAKEYVQAYLERVKDGGKEATRVSARAFELAAAGGKDSPTASMYPVEWCIEASRLYEHYRLIMRKQGEQETTMEQFTKDLGVGRTQMRRLVKGEKARSCYIGVRFKEEPDEIGAGIKRKF